MTKPTEQERIEAIAKIILKAWALRDWQLSARKFAQKAIKADPLTRAYDELEAKYKEYRGKFLKLGSEAHELETEMGRMQAHIDKLEGVCATKENQIRSQRREIEQLREGAIVLCACLDSFREWQLNAFAEGGGESFEKAIDMPVIQGTMNQIRISRVAELEKREMHKSLHDILDDMYKKALEGGD